METPQTIKPEKIPQLTDLERLELQTLLLKLTVERERTERFSLLANISRSNIDMCQDNLNIWNKKFNEKLIEVGLDMSRVHIDADTGAVTLVRN